MKNHFFQFFLILCFFVMLLFPSEVFEGAKSGLLLWFLTVLPTLFPFLLISRLLLDSCACSLLNKLLAPAISRLFGISAQGSFAFIVGFLCGYPMGAKITADLFHARQISKAEASYLLSFCNNTSPAFLIHYIVLGYFQNPRLIFPSVLNQSKSARTVTIALTMFETETYTPWHIISAAAIIASVPLIIVVLLLQKRIVSGMIEGGVKG